jgi:DNA polymerase (family 10)
MNKNITNKDVAKILNEIGTYLELQGENPFKIRAYYNAARVIEKLPKNMKVLVESGELNRVRGIGDALNKKITTLVTTGHLPYYEKLEESVPKGVVKLLEIPGLGAKKVRKLWKELGVRNIGELEYACNENRLIALEGFGSKTQQKILQGIAFLKKYADNFLLSEALEIAARILSILKSHPQVEKVSLAGSIRRKMEIIRNIDLVIESEIGYRPEIADFVVERIRDVSVFAVDEIFPRTENEHLEIKPSVGIGISIYFSSDDEFPFALRYYTGSKEHNNSLKNYAKRKGFELSTKGMYYKNRKVNCISEKDIYSKLDLEYIPPEMRENVDEIYLAGKGKIPDLVTEKDIKGCFHNHTIYSDGTSTIAEMIDKSKKLGFSYIGISDHSQSAFYANGLKVERLYEQWQEIDDLNKKVSDFKIFKSIESDILSDGQLDYPDDILKQFDYVVASVHSHFVLPIEEQTARILKAMSNSYVKILGHPTGRLLLSRDSYGIDMEQIITYAAKNDKAIEINANPYRLDLDWRWGKLAREVNLKVAISPDAHSISGLDDIKYGIYIARKAGIPKDNVLNTWNVEKLMKYFKSN